MAGVCVEVPGVGSRTETFCLWTGGIVNAERAIANMEKTGAALNGIAGGNEEEKWRELGKQENRNGVLHVA